MGVKYSLNTRRIASYFERSSGVLSGDPNNNPEGNPIIHDNRYLGANNLDEIADIEYNIQAGSSESNTMPEENKVNLGLSKKAKVRLQNSINWMTACSAKRRVSIDEGKTHFYFRVAFVTLTLPCLQFHTHAEIKSKCLNRFLTDMRRFHGIENYVWKAELQKNGNIHFHLTFDKFVHYMQIRKLWNNAIAKLGYIGEYANKFQNMNLNQYTAWRQKNSPASKERIKRAYAYGVSTNWQSPNSTDVKNVKNVEDLSAYLSKYLTKPIVDDKSNESQRLSAESFEGRTWFCSTSLSRLKSKKIDVNFRTMAIFEWFRKCKDVLTIEMDYCTCIFFKLRKLPDKIREWLRQELLSHAINMGYPFPDVLPKW